MFSTYKTFTSLALINPLISISESFGRFLVLANRRMITVRATIKIYIPFCAITLYWLTRNNSIKTMTFGAGITWPNFSTEAFFIIIQAIWLRNQSYTIAKKFFTFNETLKKIKVTIERNFNTKSIKFSTFLKINLH